MKRDIKGFIARFIILWFVIPVSLIALGIASGQAVLYILAGSYAIPALMYTWVFSEEYRSIFGGMWRMLWNRKK